MYHVCDDSNDQIALLSNVCHGRIGRRLRIVWCALSVFPDIQTYILRNHVVKLNIAFIKVGIVGLL